MPTLEHPGGVLAKAVTTLPITFTDPSTGDPLTVYGGTVTLNEDGSADLVSTHAEADLGSYTISTYNGGFFINGIPNLKAQNRVGTKLYNLGYRCDSLIMEAVQNTAYLTKDRAENTVFQRVGSASLWFWHNGLSNKTDAKDFLSGKTIVYELSDNAKQTYHFDNIDQLIAFRNTNNVWSDTGDVNVSYIAYDTMFSFGSPLQRYNYVNLKLFGNTFIEHGKG